MVANRYLQNISKFFKEGHQYLQYKAIVTLQLERCLQKNYLNSFYNFLLIFNTFNNMFKKALALFLFILICQSAIFTQNSGRSGSYTFTYTPPKANPETSPVYSSQSYSQQTPSRPYTGQTYANPSINPAAPAVSSSTSSNVSQQKNGFSNTESGQNSVNQSLKALFDSFMRTKGLYLASTDYTNPSSLNYRLSVFSQNLKMINQHNGKAGVTYKLKANRFSALTSQQFKANQLTGNYGPVYVEAPPFSVSLSSLDMKAVQSIDWKLSGKLSPVKDQGKCGACWAFSAISVIQSYVAIQRGSIPESYSEQQLIDCARVGGYGVSPCEGAWPEKAFYYINQSGLSMTRDYPYVGRFQGCRDGQVNKRKYLDPNSLYGKVSGFTNVLFYLSQGPLAVAVDANYWQFYSEGIINCPFFSGFNHAATLVGFNLANQNWIVRNSWGSDWGQGGYIRIDAIQNCGVLQHAYYPFVTPTW